MKIGLPPSSSHIRNKPFVDNAALIKQFSEARNFLGASGGAPPSPYPDWINQTARVTQAAQHAAQYGQYGLGQGYRL